MTISADYAPNIDLGNGTTLAFAVTFPFADPLDIDVTIFDMGASADVVPPPMLNGLGLYDYTITGTIDPAGTGIYPNGTVHFNTAPPANTKVIRCRSTPEMQNVVLIDNARFPAKAVEGGLDHLELQIQEMDADLSRAILAPVSDGPVDLTLPPAAERADTVLTFDAAGNIENPGIATGPLEAAIAAFLAAGSLAPTTMGWARTLAAALVLYAAPVVLADGQPMVVDCRNSIGDGYGGIFTYKAGDAATVFANSGLGFVDAAGRRWFRQRMGGLVSAMWFAAGDGVTDDTAAMQAALNSGQSVALGARTYRITARLILATVKQIIIGPGTWLYDGPITDRLYDIAADFVTLENVTLDGNNKQVFFGLTAQRANTHDVVHRFCQFQNVSGRHLGGTLNLSENNQYAVIIDSNGTDFRFIGCSFRDIHNNNMAANIPGGVPVTGAGFTGAIFTYPADGSAPPSVQGSSVAGEIIGCNFLRIDTVLDTGLSQGQLEQFNDADAIRLYGPNTNWDFFVDIDDCYFFQVGKRAVKGSGNGWMMTNSTIFAPSSMPYAMVNAITCDCSNATIRNVNCYASPGKPIHIVLKTFDGSGLYVETLNCDYCDYVWQIGPSLSTAVLADYHVKGLRCGSVALAGILQTAALAGAHSWFIDDIDFRAAPGTHGLKGFAMVAADTWIDFGTVRLTGMEFKIGEQGFSGKLLDLTIDDSAYAGADPNICILEMGNLLTAAANYPAGNPARSSSWDTIILRIAHLPSSYYTANRQTIALIYGNNLRIRQLELDVPVALTITSYPALIYGHGLEIDELIEYGDHDISFMEFAKASFGPYKNSRINRAVRKTKGEALNTPFLYIGNGQNCEIASVTDNAVTTAPCVFVADGTAAAGATKAWMLATVTHRSTHITPVYDPGSKANLVASLVRAW